MAGQMGTNIAPESHMHITLSPDAVITAFYSLSQMTVTESSLSSWIMPLVRLWFSFSLCQCASRTWLQVECSPMKKRIMYYLGLHNCCLKYVSWCSQLSSYTYVGQQPPSWKYVPTPMTTCYLYLLPKVFWGQHHDWALWTCISSHVTSAEKLYFQQ